MYKQIKEKSCKKNHLIDYVTLARVAPNGQISKTDRQTMFLIVFSVLRSVTYVILFSHLLYRRMIIFSDQRLVSDDTLLITTTIDGETL
jgi:hypothetical protein